MTPKLTQEQRNAILERGSPVAVEDDETHRVYLLVDPAMLDFLRDEADILALRRGCEDADAGRSLPLHDAMRRIEASLRSRYSA